MPKSTCTAAGLLLLAVPAAAFPAAARAVPRHASARHAAVRLQVKSRSSPERLPSMQQMRDAVSKDEQGTLIMKAMRGDGMSDRDFAEDGTTMAVVPNLPEV